MKLTINIDLLRDHLKYEPMDRGPSLVWLSPTNRRIRAGDVAGFFNEANARWYVGFFGTNFLVYRIVWALLKGEFPPCQIDHIDRNPSNNKIENLRLALRNEKDNLQNRSLGKNNKSGFTGVSQAQTKNKWVADICSDGKRIHLGTFNTVMEAVNARLEAEQRLYTFAHGERHDGKTL